MLTDVRDTREIEGRYRVFEAAAAIFCGALVAINAAGKAVPAGSSGALKVVGRAEHNAAAGEAIETAVGVFCYGNGSGGALLTAADVGGPAYVVDDETVGKTGTVIAGTVFQVDDDGVWVDLKAGLITVTQAAG